jgi:hypothetical protein
MDTEPPNFPDRLWSVISIEAFLMIRSLNSGKQPFNRHVGGASYAYLTNPTA